MCPSPLKVSAGTAVTRVNLLDFPTKILLAKSLLGEQQKCINIFKFKRDLLIHFAVK